MEKIVNEPLKHLMEKYGFDVSYIDKIVCGRKYSAVMLKNGNIGVCANLLNQVEVEIEDLKTPDLDNIEHRIILNAYFNSRLNYLNDYKQSIDIFECIDFKHYKNIVMVGLFRPLLKKLTDSNIKIHVFDMIKEDSILVSKKREGEYINKADAIVLSSTSIFNSTFMDIVNNTGKKCDIFLLGPSSIMNREMFVYKNIKKIFGSIFKPYDERVLEVIKNGFGTKKFLSFGSKEFLQ